MRPWILILAVLTGGLQACRSGHFEDRTTSQKASTNNLEVNVFESTSKFVVGGDQARVTHVDLNLELKTRDPQGQILRRQPLTIKLAHPSMASTSEIQTTTDEDGHFNLAFDLGPNEEGPFLDTYSVRTQIHTQDFGDAFGILQLDLRRSTSVGQWQESSKTQFDMSVPFDFEVEVAPQVFLESFLEATPTQRIYNAEVNLKFFRNEKTPLVNYPVHIQLRSNDLAQSFDLRTDSQGFAVLAFHLPFDIYGPFDPFTGVLSFEIDHAQGKFFKTKTLRVSLAEHLNSQILPVQTRDSTDNLQPPSRQSSQANLQVTVDDIRYGHEELGLAQDLDFQKNQAIEIQLKLLVNRILPNGELISKALRSVPTEIHWLVVQSENESLEGAEILFNERKKISTTDQGEIFLKGNLNYFTLAHQMWAKSIILAIEIPGIAGLKTIFLRVDESKKSRPEFYSRSQADKILGGALTQEVSSPTVNPGKTVSSHSFLNSLQSLSEIIEQSKDFSKDRQAAANQLQTMLHRLPSPKDPDGVRNLYLLLAKVVGVDTSDVNHSFRWNELMFIDEVASSRVKRALVESDFSDQLRRLGSYQFQAATIELTGRALSCDEFELWKPGTLPPKEEWIRVYLCEKDLKTFEGLLEPYLLITSTKTHLIRGLSSLRELKSKISNPRISDSTQVEDLLNAYDQYSLPDRKGLIIHAQFPVAR